MKNADDEDHWSRQKVLGAGAFGVVELWCNNNTGNLIAIKKCQKGSSQLTDKQKSRWILEVEKMNSLNHPNIVGTRRVPAQLGYIGKDLPVLCMEYCSRGDLRTVLNDVANCCGIEETEALRIMHHISSAVEYLHSRTLVHRDLKPENIVLQGTRQKTVYKITDFGYVRELGEMSVDASVVGTFNYLAPELLWRPKYTSSVDYWSLGILFYEVVTGNRPFLPNMPITKNWMIHIMKKSYNDVCARGDSNSVAFSSEIERPSSISDSMRHHLTPWFRVALQWDPSRRGKFPEGSENVIFKLLNQILQRKVVYVFVVGFYRVDSYAVHPNITVGEIQKSIHERTDIGVANQILVDHLGSAVNQPEAPLFSCIEEPQLVIFQKDKFHVENLPKLNMPPSVEHMVVNPKGVLKYETMRRNCAAIVFIIKQQLDLFKWYIIALSIKIDLSNASYESLEQRVQSLTINAHSLMNQLNFEAQSPEYGRMIDDLRGIFDTTVAKTQTLVKNTQEVVAKLTELATKLEQLKVFSNHDWLNDWTQLYAKATEEYDACLKRNPRELNAPVNMVQLLYKTLKLYTEQLQSPEMSAIVSDITNFDTRILQLQESLNSFEALVNIYKDTLNSILARRGRGIDASSTCQNLMDSIEVDNVILDNIVISKLIESLESLDELIDPAMDLSDLEF